VNVGYGLAYAGAGAATGAYIVPMAAAYQVLQCPAAPAAHCAPYGVKDYIEQHEAPSRRRGPLGDFPWRRARRVRSPNAGAS